jgi:hypothetical protein
MTEITDVQRLRSAYRSLAGGARALVTTHER